MFGPELRAAVEHSAAPAAVEVAITRLGEEHGDLAERLEADGRLRAALVAVTASSRALTQRLFSDAGGLKVLSDLDDRPLWPGGDGASLVRWRNLEFLRIAARDLIGLDQLEATGAALSRLAADVLAGAVAAAGADGMAVVAMGKFGGWELNYASDVDVLFVTSSAQEDSVARRVMDVARRCFRVDADLRPEGRNGPLTRTVDSYEAYWDRWADPWEFQALLKARPVAGDAAVGAAFATAAAERVWGRPFGAEELRYVREMKARVEGEVARRGLSDREVKRGPGGIRDIEFAVQLLQLVHGRLDPALRSPATITALTELASAGYVDARDAATLQAAYRFLREIEHRLQLADEMQVHAVPADDAARTRLARVLGYRDSGPADAVERFDADLRRQQAAVRAIHERLYFRPLLEAFAGSAAPVMSPEATEARLAAFGFTDVERTRQALRELTRGLTRSSRLMQQLLPLLLDWLSESADPDLGLLGLRNLVADRHRTGRLVDVFRDSPVAARRLCLLLGTSRLLHRSLERHPDVIDHLGDPDALGRRDRTAFGIVLDRSLAWRHDPDDRLTRLQRMKDAEELRVAAGDIAGLLDVEAVGATLTGLAEAVLDTALGIVAPDVPMAVIAMGRFGGAELSYASDLDVLLAYDGDGPAAAGAAATAAESLMRLVKGATPAHRIYLVDADLRPEGKQGPLARSLDGYRTYYERWAQTWERQALVRARPVAGDPGVGAAFMELVEPFVWAPLTPEAAREIRRMKARVERERIPPGEDPQFHLKLGRGSLSDVEWTAQLLQLRHGVRATGTITAVRQLEAADVVSAKDADVLVDSYRFCERTRNRWYLVKGSAGDALPAQTDQLAKLARSLGTTSSGLREEYRRVTRRARTVVETLFYGADR